jgi:hypothetical protein
MSRPGASMPPKQRSVPGCRPWQPWAVLAVAVTLAACSTAQIDQIPHAVGGLPEGAPARPATQMAYPAVHDMPPQRAQPLLDEEEQKRLEKDLIMVRNRQAPEQAKTQSKATAKTQSKPLNTGQKANP